MEPIYSVFGFVRKADETTGEFWGIASTNETDSQHERLQWPEGFQAVQQWAQDQHRLSQGRSWGNLRLAHSGQPIGILLEKPEVDPIKRRVLVHGKVTDPTAKAMLADGTLVGLSIGGKYASKRPAPGGVTEYVPTMCELSLCDRGAVPSAVVTASKAAGLTLELRKADGSTETRGLFDPYRQIKFKIVETVLTELGKALADRTNSRLANPRNALIYLDAQRAQRENEAIAPYTPAETTLGFSPVGSGVASSKSDPGDTSTRDAALATVFRKKRIRPNVIAACKIMAGNLWLRAKHHKE